LSQTAAAAVEEIAGAIRQHYPQQIVGVEAHTDNRSVAGTAWRNNHQLSAAQAMAVFDQLTEQHRLPANQLFVLGHGANHPVASNATSAGQTRNRRVEVVIYPETIP
jgi:flagellar motor protein MotB